MVNKSDTTTVQLKKSVVKELQSVWKYPRETYNEIIIGLLKVAKENKNRRQYDEFLHRTQQAKMKELWDNEDDEAWEHA